LPDAEITGIEKQPRSYEDEPRKYDTDVERKASRTVVDSPFKNYLIFKRKKHAQNCHDAKSDEDQGFR